MSSTPQRSPRPATVLDGTAAGARRPAPPEAAAEPESYGRRCGVGLLVLIGALLLLLSLPLNQVRRTAEPVQLSEHAAALLREPAVRNTLSEEATLAITRRIAGESSLGQRAIRALVEPRIDRVVASKRFSDAWAATTLLAAQRFLDPDSGQVVITVDNLADLTEAVTGPLPAALAGPWRRAGSVQLATFDRTPAQRQALRALDRVDSLAIPGLLLAGLAFLLALVVSRDRRRTVVAVGVALLAVGLLLLAAELTAKSLVLDAVEAGRTHDVTAAVWSELLGGLRGQALLAAVIGLVVAGAGTALRRARG